MLLLGLLCCCLVVAVFYRDTPVGKQLRALLIEAPAELLSKLTWAKVIVSASLLAFVGGALFVGFNVHDGVVVFMALPEILAWMAAFDIATLLELSIVVVFAAASIRVGAAVRFVAASTARLFASQPMRVAKKTRERRSRPERPDRSASDDDASAPAWGYAFAA